MENWKTFQRLAATRSKKSKDCTRKATALVEEYQSNGYLRLGLKDALNLDDCVFAEFYMQLAEACFPRGKIVSPVAHLDSPDWMMQCDFCFINVRATGPRHEEPGNFLTALKLLPMLRVSSIHLAPFFECVFGNVYAIDSLHSIAPDVVDPYYAEKGLGDREQLRLLVEAIHCLGMSVGFDLEPHTSQFSKVVIDNPEQFRWLHIAADRKGLFDGMDQDTMLQESEQEKIHGEVRSLIADILSKYDIEKLDGAEVTGKANRQTCQKAHGEIIEKLIGEGYWTLPSHTWGGVGLPEFVTYNHQDNYPEFEYLDKKGKDQGAHAFGMLTPVKFATDLHPNTLPTLKNPASPWQKGIDFFAGIFPDIQREYGFDFVRLDYVDHVFDSVIEGTRDLPLADRPTPYVIEQTISKARSRNRGLGAMAERMGYDFKDYASAGFDLILGADVIRAIDMDFIADMLRFSTEISEYNKKHDTSVSIQYAVDTHDTGHPEIDANPAQFGHKGMILRYFLARFGNCGRGRRPKYEVIGNQDMTRGLYDANNQSISLQWENDREFFEIYHNFEDVYASLKTAIDNSYLRESHLEDEYAVWYLDRADGHKMRLVCVCYPETARMTASDTAAKKKTATKPRKNSEVLKNIRIFPFNEYSFDCARIEEINLKQNTRDFIPIDPEGTFSIPALVPGEVRLYVIQEHNHA